MLPEERVLRTGYPTPEAALAPLASALPWMKNVVGEIACPRSEFIFVHGEGRRAIRYRVSLSAEAREGGFAAVIRVDRVNARLFIAPVAFAAAITVAGCFENWRIFFLLPVCGLMCANIAWYASRQAHAVFDAFSLPYQA